MRVDSKHAIKGSCGSYRIAVRITVPYVQAGDCRSSLAHLKSVTEFFQLTPRVSCDILKCYECHRAMWQKFQAASSDLRGSVRLCNCNWRICARVTAAANSDPARKCAVMQQQLKNICASHRMKLRCHDLRTVANPVHVHYRCWCMGYHSEVSLTITKCAPATQLRFTPRDDGN